LPATPPLQSAMIGLCLLIGVLNLVFITVQAIKLAALTATVGAIQKSLEKIEGSLKERTCAEHSALISEHARRLDEHDARIKDLERK
jgi:hypothetical protein